jgi:hypothetical protein
VSQRGFGWIHLIAILAVVGVITATVIGIYRSGYSAGEAAVKLEWEEASRAQKEKEANQIKAAAAALEAERAKRKVVYRTITQTVDKIVERPVYRNQCMDDDGLRCVNAALRGESASGCGAASGVPGLDPARVQGGGLRYPEVNRGGGGLRRLQGEASPAG